MMIKADFEVVSGKKAYMVGADIIFNSRLYS